MEQRRQSTTERRLAQVRALKDRYFADELTVEERLEAKDAKITLLQNEVAELRRSLAKLEAKTPSRPKPERQSPAKVTEPTKAIDNEGAIDIEEPRFDFYRD